MDEGPENLPENRLDLELLLTEAHARQVELESKSERREILAHVYSSSADGSTGDCALSGNSVSKVGDITV